MGQKRSILIVDDDVDASQMAKMFLDQTGLYDVRVCNRGSEAFEIIQKMKPELLLQDIVMPDADGAEIVGQVRQDKTLAAVRVVFMTSLVSEEETLQSNVIGGCPFISKPITGEAFLKRVKGIFEFGN